MLRLSIYACLGEDDKEQMCKGLAEAANQLLDSLKLGELN